MGGHLILLGIICIVTGVYDRAWVKRIMARERRLKGGDSNGKGQETGTVEGGTAEGGETESAETRATDGREIKSPGRR